MPNRHWGVIGNIRKGMESSMVFERKEPEKEKEADKYSRPVLWRAKTGIRAGDNVNDGLLTILEASTEIGDSLVGAR